MNDIDNIRASVLSRIKPAEAEKKRLKTLAESIIRQIDNIGEEERLDVKGILVGSSARGTWISGEHDLDIFIMFRPEVERKELEEKGLYIARKVARGSQRFEERYAEHPYIHAVFDGFDVDLVPAFNVGSASEIKSAVDRTPFHNSYVASRTEELVDDVLLLKQFMKSIGVYGSELKTKGFSGYLVELLIINYGSFENVLEATCQWKRGVMIDIEKYGGVVHKDPMVMVDPTDPARNVAAALSIDNMCIFIDEACEFLKKPDERFFTQKTELPLVDTELSEILRSRGTSIIAILFTAPDVVEDVLFPQLRKLEESIRELLSRYDFRVYNSDVWANEKTVVLFEIESAKLPMVKKHTGPFVWSREHALAFKSKYQDSNTFSNIFIREGKYMVEIRRKYPDAKQLLEAEVPGCALGKHVALSIKKEYHVLENNQIMDFRDDEFRKFLRKFFKK